MDTHADTSHCLEMVFKGHPAASSVVQRLVSSPPALLVGPRSYMIRCSLHAPSGSQGGGQVLQEKRSG
ncbi:hypothetical protein E2C01_088170 [Portunus trituberculatus]|uniref:Uncharacterized protein n=1 Tax=Portunus trituberculatus TaxID=210409 RepID=A0A5B7JL77_PORTR|nr:hypothetical protein [Portunus trituberculatus]